MSGEVGAIPLDDLGHDLGDLDRGGRADECEHTAQGEAHAQPPNEDSGLGWAGRGARTQVIAAELGEQLLGVGQVGAHELQAVVAQDEVTVFPVERDPSAIGQACPFQFHRSLHPLEPCQKRRRRKPIGGLGAEIDSEL